MELSNPFKMIPSQYYLPLALLGGGLLAWRFLFSGSEPSPSGAIGYDPSLVALGVQMSLERDKLNAQTELGKLAMQTELEALDKKYGFAGLELAVNEKLRSAEIGASERVSIAKIGSDERIASSSISADASVKHAELGVMQNIGLWEAQTAQHVANTDLQKTIAMGNAQVATAKASKKKGFSYKGFSLSF